MSGPSVPLLRLVSVSKRFGGLHVLRDLDVEIGAGEIHSLIGPNGAGKTTVFNCVMSFFPIDTGTILFAGERIDGLRPHLIARRGIARTYQNIRLFSDLSVIENVLVGAHRHIEASALVAVLARGLYLRRERALRAEAEAMLDFVGLVNVADRSVRELSYGDRRRVEIARAIAGRPKLLLLDEPAAGMNPAEGMALARLIERMRAELGVTVLLIEHHMRIVMGISDRVSVLDRGSLIGCAPPDEIKRDARIIDAYLGHPPPRAKFVDQLDG